MTSEQHIFGQKLISSGERGTPLAIENTAGEGAIPKEGQTACTGEVAAPLVSALGGGLETRSGPSSRRGSMSSLTSEHFEPARRVPLSKLTSEPGRTAALHLQPADYRTGIRKNATVTATATSAVYANYTFSEAKKSSTGAGVCSPDGVRRHTSILKFAAMLENSSRVHRHF